jgi:hypothetical protein
VTQPPPDLELELAVARGRDYLVRAVFRPPAVVSIGTNPRATIALPDAALPDFHELLHLGERGSRLVFESAMHVEMQVDGEIEPADQLIARGLAKETRDGWTFPLTPGSKGLARFGALRVLLKVKAPRDATIWNVSPESGPCCGGCGGNLKWALQSAGALSPCQRCGDLNRIEGSIADRELGETSVVKRIRPPGADGDTLPPGPSQPTALVAGAGDTLPPRPESSGPFPVPNARDAVPLRPGKALESADTAEVDEIHDTVSDADVPAVSDDLSGPAAAFVPASAGRPAKGADLPTYDGIAGMKGANLPTFDAIQVQRVGDLPPTADALKIPAEAAKAAAQSRRPARPAGLGPRSPKTPPSVPAVDETNKGANLPTFDAIQVFKDDSALSTRAAISVMKGDEQVGEPPVHPTDAVGIEAVQPRQLGPVDETPEDLKPTLRDAKPIKPKKGPAALGPDAARGALPPEEPADETPPAIGIVPEPPPPPEPIPAPEPTPPPEPPAPKPTPRDEPTVADDETRPTPRDLLPIGSTREQPSLPATPEEAAETSDLFDDFETGDDPPARAPLPPIQPEAQARPEPQPEPEPEEEEEDDDFLMGRDDGGIKLKPNLLGWALIGIGLLCGAVGCLLILVAVLHWQGII